MLNRQQHCIIITMDICVVRHVYTYLYIQTSIQAFGEWTPAHASEQWPILSVYESKREPKSEIDDAQHIGKI